MEIFRGGFDSHGAINAGVNFNLRQDKFNFTANGFYNQNQGVTDGTIYRYNYADTPTSIYQTQTE